MKTILAGLLTVVVLAGLLSAGCGWRKGADDRPPLSMFTDIPLPPKLTINAKNSKVFEKPAGRVGLMKADGRMGKQAALAFFRENMAQNGWTKDSEFDNSDEHMMIFSQSPRSAAITVTEGWFSINVEINVSAQKP